MSASLELQREIKRGWIERAIGHEVPITLTFVGEAVGYRRRARLHVHAGATGPVLGYRMLRSSRVISVEHCPILHPVLDGLLPWIAALPGLENADEVWLDLGDQGKPTVAIKTRDAAAPELYRALELAVQNGLVIGATLSTEGVSADATFGDPRTIAHDLEGQSLEASHLGFTQANDGVNAVLRERVVAWADPPDQRILELYAGNGNFTVELARGALSITTIEQSEAAVRAAKRNLATRERSANVVLGDAGEEVARLAARRTRFDVVVLDPPRAGAAECIESIVECRPQRIVYVSCDPRSLERDVRRFREHDFVVSHAEAFDMFPHAGHVEAVVRLTR